MLSICWDVSRSYIIIRAKFPHMRISMLVWRSITSTYQSAAILREHQVARTVKMWAYFKWSFEQPFSFLTRSIPGSWIGLPNSQTFPTGMFFGNCPQKFRTFTGHLWKVGKAQKFAPPSSEARESARVGLALVADQTSACRFAYTLSSCNPQCFKYS